ncbi:MAG: hypothetical protein LUD73_04210, partial [Lachnospiraceae bacterium]|nr:hypothetical protein [Lachnospiraceae bacterium]
MVGENTEAESVEDAGEGEAAEEANEDEMIVFNASVDGVDIVAAAAAGVFPEGTTMSVSMLDAEDEDTADQYNEAEAMLTESEVAYDGFVAIDISFFYVNDENESEKIEPEDGTVSVKISVDTNLLGENADKDSLSVQHLEEDEDGSIEIKTVADAASGSVTVENGSAEAEFEVESFSTYVVTWVDNSEEHKYIKDQKPRIAHLYFVDVSGNDISDKLGVLENEYEVTGGGNLKSCVDGSNVDNALNVLGEKYNNKNGTSYSYVAAHLDDIDGTVATNISYNDNGEKGAGWHYHDGNNWQLWGTFETEEGTRSGKTDEEVDVYLVYYNTKLTEVNTVDSTSLGITMRMIDYSTAANGLS